jgi:hypothetical protein
MAHRLSRQIRDELYDLAADPGQLRNRWAEHPDSAPLMKQLHERTSGDRLAPVDPDPEKGPVITSFIFRVRNVPAAVYKALGGFATNGVNMTKLESYMIGGNFTSAQFYADVEGHPEQPGLRLAFEELDFFSRSVKILGVYYAHPFRHGAPANDG